MYQKQIICVNDMERISTKCETLQGSIYGLWSPESGLPTLGTGNAWPLITRVSVPNLIDVGQMVRAHAEKNWTLASRLSRSLWVIESDMDSSDTYDNPFMTSY